MDIYVVGGAIRDQLLGLSVQDYDYVVVGATPAQMIAQGYRPVGRDFPVFLHPKTHAEYALARTERKTALGYHGFQFYYAPDVTLEQDLARRDLTINAMARAANLDGQPIGPVIDLFNGRADLKAHILRHVGPAFAEDPVRILRLARFAARLTSFKVAATTLALMRTMIAAGEVDALVSERVWQEISRGLMQAQPSRMFEILRACGALARLMPEIDPLLIHAAADGDGSVMAAIDHAAKQNSPLTVRFAVLMSALTRARRPDGPATEAPLQNDHDQSAAKEDNSHALLTLCNRLKVPKPCRDLAWLVIRECHNISDSLEFDAAALVQLFERCDALRQPKRFAEALQACAVYAPKQQTNRLYEALLIARAVDAGAIAAHFLEAPATIKKAVHCARVTAVKVWQARMKMRAVRPA